ncbi:hypothetical protein KKG31_02960 [Patescibacteria group bacterium]|nr:hypothetical protein [Patescibacteria group bacterium]MBU1758121.1 hypothetical protein [Patescibacteria group bacterium]
MCLHTISDDKYYDIVFSDWTQGVWGSPPGSGGGFAYSRTEYLFVTNTGDACDCTDSICTTGNDYTGNLICTPVDPACSTTPPIIIPPAPP